jgi:probable O-glycosylation ligase (exosortase A-associated)
MSPHRLVWGFPSAIPLALISAILTMVSWLFSREPKALHFDATVLLICAFMGWISFTTLSALDSISAVVEWNRVIKELLFVLITVALTTNRIRFHALLWIMAVAIGYFGLKGAVFSILNGGQFNVYGPPDTAIYDNNDIGAGLVVALPLMNYVRTNSADSWVRMGWLIVMACSCLSIVGSYSRGAALGLVVVIIFLWIKSRRKLVLGIFIGLMATSAIAFMPEQYMERMRTIQTYEKDNSAMSRIQIWGAAIKIAMSHPLTGGGFRATESQRIIDRYEPGIEARAPHNIYLSVLSEHGFIGFSIWAAMLFVGWRNIRWLVRYSEGRPKWQWAGDFGRMAQVSLVGYCVVGSFGNYAYWDYYFTLIGLAAAVRHMMQQATLPQGFTGVSRASPSPTVN